MINDATKITDGEKKVLLRVANLKKYFPIEKGFAASEWLRPGS